MLAPVLVVGTVMVVRKAHAYQAPQYRILMYPNCHPAWAGGTIWQQGLNGTPKTIGPYCDGPTYIPGFMPYFVGDDLRGVVVVATDTNYCGFGDINLGFAYTQVTHDGYFWYPIPGTTNQITMPSGFSEAEWKTTSITVSGLGSVIKLDNAFPIRACPGNNWGQ